MCAEGLEIRSKTSAARFPLQPSGESANDGLPRITLLARRCDKYSSFFPKLDPIEHKLQHRRSAGASTSAGIGTGASTSGRSSDTSHPCGYTGRRASRAPTRVRGSGGADGGRLNLRNPRLGN